MLPLRRLTAWESASTYEPPIVQQVGSELFRLVDQQDCLRLLLNFSEVEFLSSAGLGKLITLDKKLKARGGKVRLSNLSPELHDIFRITRLDKLFEIEEDEADALEAFEQTSDGPES